MDVPGHPDVTEVMCYRHPDREFAVGCQRCDRPICVECMRSASVGHHCPDCAKTGSQKVIRGRDLQFRPVLTQVLLGLIAAVFVAQAVSGGSGFLSGAVYRDGVLFGPFVADGELWRIVTSGFLHASLWHIGFNAYALWLFGQTVERAVGSLRMGLIYAGGLFGGASAVLAFNFDQPTLGASGAVLGLAGGLAGIVMARGGDIRQTNLGGIFLMNLALPILFPGISFWGHAGGIAGGFAVGYLLASMQNRTRQPSPTGVGAPAPGAGDPSVVAAGGLVVGLAALAVALGTVVQGVF